MTCSILKQVSCKDLRTGAAQRIEASACKLQVYIYILYIYYIYIYNYFNMSMSMSLSCIGIRCILFSVKHIVFN